MWPKRVIFISGKVSFSIFKVAMVRPYLHAYIVVHYSPSTRITTSLMLCVLILHMNGGFFSLKSTLNDRIFEKLLRAILYSEDRNLLRGSRRKNISYDLSTQNLRWLFFHSYLEKYW